MISRSRHDSVGGGVVAEFFSNLQELTRFSGGGVVAESFRDLQEPTWISGGGSSRIFPSSPVAKSHFYPTLSDIRDFAFHVAIKFHQFREFPLQFRETWRSRPVSGDSRKFRETWQVCV